MGASVRAGAQCSFIYFYLHNVAQQDIPLRHSRASASVCLCSLSFNRFHFTLCLLSQTHTHSEEKRQNIDRSFRFCFHPERTHRKSRRAITVQQRMYLNWTASLTDNNKDCNNTKWHFAIVRIVFSHTIVLCSIVYRRHYFQSINVKVNFHCDSEKSVYAAQLRKQDSNLSIICISTFDNTRLFAYEKLDWNRQLLLSCRSERLLTFYDKWHAVVRMHRDNWIIIIEQQIAFDTRLTLVSLIHHISLSVCLLCHRLLVQPVSGTPCRPFCKRRNNKKRWEIE